MTVTGRRTPPTAARPEVRVVAGARQRLAGRLDHAVDDAPPDPSLADVVAAARAFPQAESWMIAGGEPTLRDDFPQLVRALADAGAPGLGLVTDGLALGAPNVPAMLKQLGLKRVRVRLASARADAHDWLFDQSGAFKRAVKGLRACVDAGLEAEVECSVTRPTGPYLDEALDFFTKIGARTVVLRRVTARGPAADTDIAVAARFGLVGKDLEKAAQLGLRSGLNVWVEGFPQCVAPGAKMAYLPTDAVVWAVPSTGPWPFLKPRFEPPPAERGCGACPGGPACCGAPTDYTRRFGRMEIDSEGVKLVNPGKLPPTPLAGGDTFPPPRGGRFPQSRATFARMSAQLPSLGGDPLALVARSDAPDALRFVFLAPSRIEDPALGDRPGPDVPEPTRDIRQRLVRAAQVGAPTLRIASAGSLWHPEVAEMLREATRLEFDRIEVAGDASALDRLGDMELRRLRGITRIDGALLAADAAGHDAIAGHAGAWEATLRALDRAGTLVPSLEIGVYAVLTSADQLLPFAEAWDRGDLPGAPFFRLAPRGGSLTALARAAAQLPQGAARDAIAAVLPPTIFDRPEHVVPAPIAEVAWGEIPESWSMPSGLDRFGCYTAGLDSSQRADSRALPGYAVGWTTAG